MQLYSTNDLMGALDIGRNTLRLYEAEGLLLKPTRTESGYRKYTDQHLTDLKFIKSAKDAGFTLAEIKGLLTELRKQNQVTCGVVSLKIKGKLIEVDQELFKLQSKKTFLNDFLNTCESKNRTNKCDIVAAGFKKNACCN